MKKKYGEKENRAHLYPFPFLFQTALGAIKKKEKRKLSPEPEVNNKAKKAAKKNRMEANNSF